MHDGRILALLFRAAEPEPLVARAGGRDSAVTQDDHVAIYLATSGSAFLQIAVNSVGAILDAKATGPHIARPVTVWNAPIEVQTDIRYGAWTARINLPLQECALALGEVGIPRQWRVLISRYRAPRTGEPAEVSVRPVVGSFTFYGPMRYDRLVLSDLDPSRVAAPADLVEQRPRAGLAGELAALESRVWSALHRRYHGVRSMVSAHAIKRAEQAILAERRDWESVNTREDWERFRDSRLQALREAVGALPAERPPLDVRVTARHNGEGYRLENLVYQSRPGFYATANLYLPAVPAPTMPAIVIQHSHHYPRTQGELHDMGELWARVGCAVLLVERLGFGERVETNPWHRQAYASRFTFKKQLGLIGETHMGWMAWDLIRAVDLLCERPDIDQKRILLIGSVAGGGEPAAVAAALDPRIAAVAPFNYDQGHIRLDADFFGQISRQISPWFVSASIAPRRFVRAFEFGWEGAEEPDFPELWVSGWLRSQRVWGFYDAMENLASSQAYGLIRLSMERVSHCFSIGPQQREELYPSFQRWFKIPFPAPKDRNLLPDSELSINPQREAARAQEAERRRPHSDLLCINPAVSAQLARKPLHRIARETGLAQLKAARAGRWDQSSADQRLHLRRDLAVKLGAIEPPSSPRVEILRTQSLSGASVEAIGLEVESGIAVPLLLVRPSGTAPVPVVVAVAQGGKERFLVDRAGSLERLIRGGIAVCLADVRGIGETSPDPDRSDDGAHRRLAEFEFSLGNTLLGARVRDLRAVLAYLRMRSDIDGQRIALWGDSFAPPNPRDLRLDELQWEAGPQIQYQAEPLGAHLVLLTALYDEAVSAVAAQGGLDGYLSILGDAFAYVPMDIIVPGILKIGDIADIAAAIAPRPALLEGFVNGRNEVLSAGPMSEAFAPVSLAYKQSRAAAQLVLRAKPAEPDVIDWLIARLR
jgi:dienelactone hydrolase